MKHKILPLLYSGLLSCTAPKAMNPVPEVRINSPSRKVQEIMQEAPPSIEQNDIPIEEIGEYVTKMLQEIKEKRSPDYHLFDGIGYHHPPGIYHEVAYRFFNEPVCDYLAPSLIKKKLMVSISFEQTVNNSKIEVFLIDRPPFGKIDHVEVHARNRSIPLSLNILRYTPWPEAQELYSTFLRELYQSMRTHKEKGKGADNYSFLSLGPSGEKYYCKKGHSAFNRVLETYLLQVSKEGEDECRLLLKLNEKK